MAKGKQASKDAGGNMVKSLAKKKTRSSTLKSLPDNQDGDVNKRRRGNANVNTSPSVARKTRVVKATKGQHKLTTNNATLIDEDAILEMEVGQDAEFQSDFSSDEESGVIEFKGPDKEESGRNTKTVEEAEKTDEEEDASFNQLMEKNYQMAGLSSKDDDGVSNQTGGLASNDKNNIIDAAVSRFQEVF